MGFPAQTVPTRAAAEKLELKLKTRKAAGDVETAEPTTLGEETDWFLGRLQATGGLRPRTVEFYEHKGKVWLPLRTVRVSALRRAQVEDLIAKRATEHPRAAKDELEFLKRVLKDARSGAEDR